MILGLSGTAIALALLAGGYAIGTSALIDRSDAASVTGSTVSRAETETIIREYILDNPEIILEAQTALMERQQETQRLAMQDVVKAEKAALYDVAGDTILGNPAGKTSIVEFFDYNCGYCKRAMTDTESLIKANPDLKVIIKEYPILGADSQKAHIVSTAFRSLMPEKAAEYHLRLLGSAERSDEAKAIALALELGANEADLRKAMEQPEVIETLQKTFELANKLEITGTPTYVVGNQLVYGAVGFDELTKKLAQINE